MGAPIGNCNACKGIGKIQHGKKSGFRNTLKKRYGAKLHQHNKKSGFKNTLKKRYNARLHQYNKVSGLNKKV